MTEYRDIFAIVDRKVRGIDCDQDESALVKRVLREAADSPERAYLTSLFPLEWDEVASEGCLYCESGEAMKHNPEIETEGEVTP
jgi:hypothetical protein